MPRSAAIGAKTAGKGWPQKTKPWSLAGCSRALERSTRSGEPSCSFSLDGAICLRHNRLCRRYFLRANCFQFAFHDAL